MPTCGRVSRQSLRHGGLDREYLYLLPRGACGKADGEAHRTLSALRLPLLVLVHCFGCRSNCSSNCSSHRCTHQRPPPALGSARGTSSESLLQQPRPPRSRCWRLRGCGAPGTRPPAAAKQRRTSSTTLGFSTRSSLTRPPRSLSRAAPSLARDAQMRTPHPAAHSEAVTRRLETRRGVCMCLVATTLAQPQP